MNSPYTLALIGLLGSMPKKKEEQDSFEFKLCSNMVRALMFKNILLSLQAKLSTADLESIKDGKSHENEMVWATKTMEKIQPILDECLPNDYALNDLCALCAKAIRYTPLSNEYDVIAVLFEARYDFMEEGTIAEFAIGAVGLLTDLHEPTGPQKILLNGGEEEEFVQATIEEIKQFLAKENSEIESPLRIV